MKAILCSQYCGPDDLVLTDVPDPVAAPGEAVIAIKSAALNFFDLLMIQGKYQIKPPLPVRIINALPWLQGITARFIGLGVRPEHVRSPEL